MTRFDFDPTTTVLGLSIRWETLALAGVILLVLVLAAVSSGRSHGGAVAGPDGHETPRLRRDDLILIGFGAVPGAVVGGRLSYALVHLDYYRANPGAITDPSQGGFGLTLAVVLGTLSAIAVARLLAAPIGRWLGVAAVPVLIGLGLGKFTMALGGVGQGRYTGSRLATAFEGSGPWGSINPAFAAFPSQIAEGALVLAAAVLVLVAPFVLRWRVRATKAAIETYLAPRRDWLLLTGGRRFMTVLSLWAAARFVAAFTWRDTNVLGPFVADQFVLALVVALGLVGPELLGGVRRGRRAMTARWVVRRSARAAARAEEKAELAARAEQAAAVAVAAETPVVDVAADPAPVPPAGLDANRY